ncbi:hypothetical protein VTO42DRAFT_7853 [Malbranchea cinnamomea]
METVKESTETAVEQKEVEARKEEAQDSAARTSNAEEGLPLSGEGGLVKTPFPRPAPTCKPPSPPQLTPEQQTKYDTLLRTVSEWKTVPISSAKNAATDIMTDDERMFLTRECLLRYLRATKWNVKEAETRLQATLIWRREYGLDKLTPEYISIENETGKQVIIGYDNDGRPCLYLNPARQNTEHSDRQIQHLVFMLERVIDLMVPDQESLALVVNFKDTRSGQNATLAQGRQTLHILQNHYPERLGRAMVINMPIVIVGFMKLITPFIDPMTRQKLKFNEDLRQLVPPSQLLKAVGGDVEFEYDHSVYWPALNELAAQRRKEYRERWIQGGKRVGEHENYLRGGSGKSLAETQAEVSALEEKLGQLEVASPNANGARPSQPANVAA